MVSDTLNLDARSIGDEVVALLKRVAGDDLDTNARSIGDEIAALFKRLAGEPNPDALLNSHEVAELLKLSDRTLERHRAAGTGPAYIAVGGVIRYLRRDVLVFIEQNRRLSTSALGPPSEIATHPIQRASARHDGGEIRREARLAQRRITNRNANAAPWVPRPPVKLRRRPQTRPPNLLADAKKRLAKEKNPASMLLAGASCKEVQRKNAATRAARSEHAETCKFEVSHSSGLSNLASQKSGTGYDATLLAANNNPLKAKTPDRQEGGVPAVRLDAPTITGESDVAIS